MQNTLPCLLKSPAPFWLRPTNSQTCDGTEPVVTEASLLDGITNPRIRQLISSHKQLHTIIDDNARREVQRQHAEEVRNNRMFLKQFDERRWLTKKGKKYLIDFDNEERKEMKQYFSSLDKKKCGSIGIDELQELMLSVGLLQTREEIKALIDSVDEDKSGKIEFGEFLSMIQNDEGPNQEIVSFFKTVIGENSHLRSVQSRGLKNLHKMPKSGLTDILEKHPYPKGLSFEMVVSHIRRKHMMTALNIGHPNHSVVTSTRSQFKEGGNGDNGVEQIAKGQRVMQALQKMYQRKLILQIKQSKRASQLSQTEKGKPRRADSQPWGLCHRTS